MLRDPLNADSNETVNSSPRRRCVAGDGWRWLEMSADGWRADARDRMSSHALGCLVNGRHTVFWMTCSGDHPVPGWCACLRSRKALPSLPLRLHVCSHPTTICSVVTITLQLDGELLESIERCQRAPHVKMDGWGAACQKPRVMGVCTQGTHVPKRMSENKLCTSNGIIGRPDLPS